MFEKIHLLFICNFNINRSPIAASLFDNSPYYTARSAGLHPAGSAKYKAVPVSQELVDWADKIFVMSEKQEKQITYLKEKFNVEGKHISDLEIADAYNTSLARDYDNLKDILKEKLHDYLVEPKGR